MDVREALAAYAHEAWSDWMTLLFEKSETNDDGSVTIQPWAAQKWAKRAGCPYTNLPPSEQLSALAEADKMLQIIVGEGWLPAPHSRPAHYDSPDNNAWTRANLGVPAEPGDPGFGEPD